MHSMNSSSVLVACSVLAVACSGLVTAGDGVETGRGSADSGAGGGGGGRSDDAGNGGEGVKESVRAFPGAEGFGALATGGRGGRVIKVTNLSSGGPGSLQNALNQNEARIIVFTVSGVIDGDIEVPFGNVTIAGQTAPGAGITIRGRLSGAYQVGVDNMIIRHIRVRPQYEGEPGNQFDAIQFSRNARLIFDHVSASFGVDETVDLYEARDVTVQWSTIESSATQGHPEGEHNYGLINGPDGRRITLHHNLFAHHKNRAPAIANGPAEVVNNVMYNVRHGFIHHNPASGQFNIEGNYFKAGKSSTLVPFFFDDEDDFAAADLGYFLTDNYIDDATSDCKGSVENPWTQCSQDLYAPASRRSASKFDFSASGDFHLQVATEASEVAFSKVLAGAGAFPRDIVTRNSVADTANGTGAWGAVALPSPLDGLSASAAPVDSDGDGIADAWETAHGLDPANASDNQTMMASGYPAIEEYINALADALLTAS